MFKTTRTVEKTVKEKLVLRSPAAARKHRDRHQTATKENKRYRFRSGRQSDSQGRAAGGIEIMVAVTGATAAASGIGLARGCLCH